MEDYVSCDFLFHNSKENKLKNICKTSFIQEILKLYKHHPGLSIQTRKKGKRKEKKKLRFLIQVSPKILSFFIHYVILCSTQNLIAVMAIL